MCCYSFFFFLGALSSPSSCFLVRESSLGLVAEGLRWRRAVVTPVKIRCSPPRRSWICCAAAAPAWSPHLFIVGSVLVFTACSKDLQFAFSVIVKQALGLSPEEPVTAMILEDFLTFMKGLISFPLRIPGTPYAKAVQARERISSTMKGFIEERRKADCCKRDDFLNVLLSTEKMKASAVCPKGTCSGWACHGLVSHVFSRHIFAWLQV